MLSKKVVDALGNATDYEYDTAGRVTKTVSPDTGTTTYTYNTAGTLATKTDAGNVTISYRYDALNRLTTIDFPADVDITYTYDDCTNGKGRVCTMTDQAGTTKYEYDKLGRIVKEKKAILGVTYITSYFYDKAGTLTSITPPSGRQLTYTYDKINRPAGVAAKLKDMKVLASSMTYDPISNLTSLTLGNGLTQSQTYNAARRISTIAVPGVMSLSYGYDPVGNITNITDALDPVKSKTYTYDSLDRLASAMGPWGTLAWTYDANGNRLAQGNGVNYAYTYSANRLTTVSNGHIDNFQYDDNGNTKSDGHKDFVYNQNQRLIKVEKHGRIIGEYVYNGNGQRVIKKTKEHEDDEHGERDSDDDNDHHITVFHYDPFGQLIEETTAKGKLIADYVYLNGKPLAMIRKQDHKDETFFYHNDHLGTPKVLTDKNKKVVWNVEFDPFGNALDDDEREPGDKVYNEDSEHKHHGRHGEYIRNVTNNLRFPGQYFDEETGLHQNYFRDYDPRLGRYIERDILGIEGGLNLYNYTPSNPLAWIDPKGLFSTYDAVRHYFTGNGQQVTLNFSEVDTGLQPRDFSGYNALVNSFYKREVTSPVDLRAQRNLGGWAGNQRYRLNGTIKSTVCEWNFTGYIGAFDNPFDFNALPWGERSYWAEFVTREIGFYGPMLNGQDYNITFTGHREVQDGGRW